MKSLYGLARKIHRWLAIPTVALVPLMIVMKIAGRRTGASLPASVEMIQQLIMLGLVITGLMLFLIPRMLKRRRASGN